MAYLDGEIVDEAKKNYKIKYGKIAERKEAHRFIDRLAVSCKEKLELESPPDSLVATCEEFKRIRSAL